MSQLTKARLDIDGSGVEYGLRNVVPAAEVKRVLEYCKERRDKEKALGLKPDPFMSLFALPPALVQKIEQENGGTLSSRAMQAIVERDYPAFKTTNYKLPITQ